jgi:photosystem II stability/assembly factor-like uncharacterized protein
VTRLPGGRAALLAAIAFSTVACGNESIELRADRTVRGSVTTRELWRTPVRIHGFSAARAFVYLKDGTVLETADRGRTWRRARIRSPFGTPRLLSRTHWLASRGRSLYETRDGGRTWRLARRLVPALRAGHFVDERFAFACARVCTLSADGGITAVRVDPPPSTYCSSGDLSASVAFSGPHTGLAICGGVPGAGNQDKEIWATTGGRRWRLLGAHWGYGYVGRIEPLGGRAFVHHSARLNDQITDDGGRTWHGALPLESATFASWVDSRVGWAFERHGGNVFRTVDGGRSWRRVAPDFWPAQTSFCDPRTGFGIGEPSLTGRDRASVVFATTDGGRRWTRRSRIPSDDVEAIACVTGRDVVVAASVSATIRFRLFRSRDAGRRWTRIRVPSDATIPTFVSPDVGFAVGDRATLLATRDGGRTWRREKLPGEELSALGFRSQDVGFVAVEPTSRGKVLVPQRLLRTTNGGRTWKRVPIRVPFLRIVGITAASDESFWIAGVRCRTFRARCKPLELRTTDDGKHWLAIERRREVAIEGAFVSRNVGVAAGIRGLYVTRDGGVTWRWRPRGRF